MVGKQAIAERTRAKKFSNLVNAKIESPKKVGTTSNASTRAAKGAKKKSRQADELDIVIVTSSSPEPETDDDVKFLNEEKVEINDESKKGERNGEKIRATKKRADKQRRITIKEAEARPEKKKMIKSPKKIGTTSNASISAAKGTKKKSREADKSDIAIVPSSSPEPETDDDVKIFCEEKVRIDDQSEKGKGNGEKIRATKKRADKQRRITIKEAEARPERKKMIKSPKKIGTTSNASISAANGTKKKSSEADESDIAIVPSSSPEPETDDDVKIFCEEKVRIDDQSEKGKGNGEEIKATKKGADKQNLIKIKEAEARPEKKKMNDASRRQSESKKEDKKKLKKLEEEEKLSEEEEETIGTKQRSESKKQDKKPKGKEVEAKSPDKLKKVSDVSKPRTEGKKDDMKKKVDGEKERTGKRRNEGEKEDKRDEKRQKMNVVEAEQQRNGANKWRDEGAKKEDKKENERQKIEVAEAEKQMNETNKQRNEGAKKEKRQETEKKQENKKQKMKKKKKKVAEMEEQISEAGQQGRQGKKEDKKDKKKKKKNMEIETEDEEENEKSSDALYKFPMNRISRIIKSEDLNNKIAQEAVFVINKASEKFLELFCREAYACAFLDHKNHIAYSHLSSVVSKRRRFDFLSDFVPEKVKAEAALAEMSEMSKAETETETET